MFSSGAWNFSGFFYVVKKINTILSLFFFLRWVAEGHQWHAVIEVRPIGWMDWVAAAISSREILCFAAPPRGPGWITGFSIYHTPVASKPIGPITAGPMLLCQVRLLSLLRSISYFLFPYDYYGNASSILDINIEREVIIVTILIVG